MTIIEPPQKGTEFYIPSFCTPDHFIHRIWYGHDEDIRILGTRMAFTDKEEAAEVARKVVREAAAS